MEKVDVHFYIILIHGNIQQILIVSIKTNNSKIFIWEIHFTSLVVSKFTKKKEI